MLSIKTVSHLNSGCETSNTLYQEGGVIYLYTFGHNRAHSFIDNIKLAQAKSEKWFEDTEKDTIALFFEKSLSAPFSDGVSNKTQSFVGDFLDSLKKDFTGMYAFISSHDADDDICNILTLTFIKGNDFHSLELFWSIE
jgi:hypothetical protein